MRKMIEWQWKNGPADEFRSTNGAIRVDDSESIEK